MSKTSLSSSSFIVLGFLERFGPSTSYDLKQCADGSVGYFWSFSRSQLYKEPASLVALGLLSESKEKSGRKRRLYSITKAGRAALKNWLREETGAPTEIRDIGLLKLYFAQAGTQDDLMRLIQDQIAAHRHRLAEYETIQESLSENPDWAFHYAACRMGLLYEQMAVDFWKKLEKEPLPISD